MVLEQSSLSPVSEEVHRALTRNKKAAENEDDGDKTEEEGA